MYVIDWYNKIINSKKLEILNPSKLGIFLPSFPLRIICVPSSDISPAVINAGKELSKDLLEMSNSSKTIKGSALPPYLGYY